MAFQGAHSFSIGILNATEIQKHSTPDPISIIHNARAVEATHTSKTASYAPKCHPGTRVKVTGDVVDWASAGGLVLADDGDERSTSICWFQGPASGGKTCIMREVAKRLGDKGMLAGTYFFSNRVPGLSSAGPFVATVAHQLLDSIPDAKPAILKAIAERASIFSESVETQMDRLILNPLREISRRGIGGRHILVIDGFDECIITERGHLLRVLHTLATSTPSLLITIASRPELDIRTTFHSERYEAITHFLRLQDYEETSAIRGYLCDEFCRIRETHPAKASIPASWPEEAVLGVLVQKSSGSYILPSTVIKYVDNPRRRPVALLEEVMELFEIQTSASLSNNPLAPLDALYDMILHPAEGDIVLIKRIMHCMS
ncbi:hypothetical protein FA13DRAFT_1739717 [Coprinellus micaceus]|uniref:Nephrocystin 3-like N-terminal domain-containing protein n=1 Tax=Coprinellus micaceus TaxID=71717 RepID=A0A4Y7SR58_COPMI|nr:hypothetical protein FA13DRAFT_1739717 [Coprinellus micaceus]